MSERKKFAPPEIQEFAPKFAEVTDSVLFGDIWERPGLSPRDRSLVTVTALASLCRHRMAQRHDRDDTAQGERGEGRAVGLTPQGRARP